MVAPHKVSLVSDVFAGLGISIVSGHPILGGFIGEPEYCEELISHKVNGWVHSINALAKAAKKSTQAAFAAMVKSLQFEWSYVQRVVSNCGPVLQQLLLSFFQLCLMEIFQIWRLPYFSYRLGWEDLVFMIPLNCVMLTLLLPSQGLLLYLMWLEVLLSLIGLIMNTWLECKLLLFLAVKEFNLGIMIDYIRLWITFLRRAVGGGISYWLTTFPLQRYHFDLAPTEFRDALV